MKKTHILAVAVAAIATGLSCGGGAANTDAGAADGFFGGDATGATPNYDGTWEAKLDTIDTSTSTYFLLSTGTFTFVVAGSTVTSLSSSFDDYVDMGGTSCEASSTCVASSACAKPELGTIAGNGLHVSKSGSYEVTGSFDTPSSASGDIHYVVGVGTPDLCTTSWNTTWTATKP